MISELVEDPLAHGSDPILEGVTFYVKYLGSCIVESASGEETTAKAVKTIISMVRLHPSKCIKILSTYKTKNMFV